MDLSLTQIGLLLDAFGFVLVFLFGGFSFGISNLITKTPAWYVQPAKIIGSIMVVGGFVLQFIGATG